PLKSHDPSFAYGVSGLSRGHRIRVDSLILHGQTDRARKELEEDLAFVRSALVAETNGPEIVLSEALTLTALGRWSGEFTPIRSPLHSQPPYSIQGLERDIAELAARRFGLLPSIGKPPWIIMDDLPADAWADRIISSIEIDAARFQLDRTRLPAIAYWL